MHANVYANREKQTHRDHFLLLQLHSADLHSSEGFPPLCGTHVVN